MINMKKLLLALPLVFMVSCVEDELYTQNNDECQYIYYHDSNGKLRKKHSTYCLNPIHYN